MTAKRGRPPKGATPEEQSQKIVAGLRLDPEDAERLRRAHQAQVKRLAAEGMKCAMTDTLRMVLRKGLDAIESAGTF